MKKLTIPDAETVILGLQDEIRRSAEARYDHRLHGLLLVAHGLSAREVAQLLGDAPRTVAYWVRRFETDGLAGLVDTDRPGRPRRLTEDQMTVLGAALRQRPAAYHLAGNLWDGKLLAEFLRREWDVRLGVRQCQRLFRQLGFRWRKPRPVLASADPEQREAAKKLRSLASDDGVELWALDEVHFQQHGSRCRMWVPPEEKDPVLLHHPTRRSVGYFGAVRLRDGKFVFRREPHQFNAETFWVFLRHLRSLTAPTRRRVVLISDNAKYHPGQLHKPWREHHADRLALEFLPPYSPDMNPIERVWKMTRRQATHNRYFPSLEDILIAVEKVFCDWRNGNETLRRLCAIT